MKGHSERLAFATQIIGVSLWRGLERVMCYLGPTRATPPELSSLIRFFGGHYSFPLRVQLTLASHLAKFSHPHYYSEAYWCRGKKSKKSRSDHVLLFVMAMTVMDTRHHDETTSQRSCGLATPGKGNQPRTWLRS